MGGGERLEFGEHLAVPARREHQVDELLPGGQLHLGQPCRLLPGPPGVGELRQRGTAPQAQRLPVAPGGLLGIGAGGRACIGDQIGEAEGVHLVRVDVEQVPGRTGQHRLAGHAGRGQGPAQLGHPHLQRVRGVGRQRLAPQRVDQGRDGDHAPGRERQQRQQLPLTAPGQLPDLPVGDHLDRPEDADLHATPLSEQVRSGRRFSTHTAVQTTSCRSAASTTVSGWTADGQRTAPRLHQPTPRETP
jgi:hypothetical protein